MSTSNPLVAAASSTRDYVRTWHESALRVVALVATLTFAAVYESRHLLVFSDSDVWWRLRTGLWILQNHAVPRAGLFSQAASRPWVDASWGFDALLALCRGAAGLPGLLMWFQIAIAVALFWLAIDASRRLWPAVALAAVAQYCVMPLQLRPALCSVALLSIELALLLRARRTGDTRALYWLPLVFLAWANLDWQFSYGLLVLALFSTAVVIAKLGRQWSFGWVEHSAPEVSLFGLSAVALASVLATFVTPYTWRLYALVLTNISSSPADRFFREMHSLRFHQPQDYLLLLLVMTAFFALGRRRSRDLFLLSLLAVSAATSFRFMRDSWFVVVCSVAIIANALREQQADDPQTRLRGREKLSVAALALVASVFATPVVPLRGVLKNSFPVGAADYIRQSHLPQSLFNTRDWGGFLTWYLPEYPVSIDGRVDLYGDDLNIAYFKLMQAEVPLESNPSFAPAQTILLEANSPMAQALSTLPGFRVAYQDEQAVVLVRAAP